MTKASPTPRRLEPARCRNPFPWSDLNALPVLDIGRAFLYVQVMQDGDCQTWRMSLEVINATSFPKESALFGKEMAEASARLEDSADFSEEDAFLVQVYDRDFTGIETALDEYTQTFAKLSQDFPDLVFQVDFSEDSGEDDQDVDFRWYFLDGKRQEVVPYQVVPEFDPAELK